MKAHVLVTGGAGYLGTVLCEHLLKSGYRVTVIDNLLYNQHSMFHLCSSPSFDFIRGDVRDEQLLRSVVRDMDILIPLAAIVGATACDRDPWLAESVNLESVRLIDRLRCSKQLVVFPNTNSGYGTKISDMFCTEETPLDPITLYGRTKVEAEKHLLNSSNVITLRLATVFGMSPRMRLDLLVNHFVYTAVTDGTLVLFESHFKRNFVHVRDVADCFLHCIEHADTMVGRPYNVGLSSANLSKEELAVKVKHHVPDLFIQCAEIGQDPDKRNYIVDNSRLKKTGFEASRTLESGIPELIKGYRMMGIQPFKNA